MLLSVRGVCHIALKSRDLEKTERFYVDVLGFEQLFPEEEMLFLETPSGGGAVSFIGTEEPFDPSAPRWSMARMTSERPG